MKQKDLMLLAIIVFMSSIFSFIICKTLLGSPKHNQQKVEVVEAISSDFPLPDNRYFNGKSIDPTQIIQIGNSTNPSPFKK